MPDVYSRFLSREYPVLPSALSAKRLNIHPQCLHFGSSHFLFEPFFARAGKAGVFCFVSFTSSSDVAVHAAQRMDGVGDSQWLVPGYPRSKDTFCSLAQCEVAYVWDREAELHPTTGQVASGALQGHPRGCVGECQEACLWIGAMIAKEPSFSIGRRSSSSELGSTGCPQCPTCSVGEGVGRRRNQGATSGGRSFCGASHKACRVGCRGLSQLKAKLAKARLREGAARAPHSEHPALQEFLPCLIMPRKWSNG